MQTDRFQHQNLTEIQTFYKGTTVFLTGATGFIGKLFLEKILRSLPVTRVFVLIRSKKGKSAAERLGQIFESPAFDVLKKEDPKAFNKVHSFEGDCCLPDLGLSCQDQNVFIKQVDVVVHCAATTRFDEKLQRATFINIRGTRDVIRLAKRVEKLKSFIYIGTAYSNSNRLDIDEKIYDVKISAEKLIRICESLDDEVLDFLTPNLTAGWPNTYTFTKQITEDYINRECKDLPVCICRPTIVISTAFEPVVAFSDNPFSLAGFILGTALGIIRIIYIKHITLDIIPADYVVNECIAAGWYSSRNFKGEQNSKIPVFNISSGEANPLDTEDMMIWCRYYGLPLASPKVVQYPYLFTTTHKSVYLFWRVILHLLPAFVMDLGLRLTGKQAKYAKLIQRIHNFMDSYEFFTTNNFHYNTDNMDKLLKQMSFADKEVFNFDLRKLNWFEYFRLYIRGLRIFILKDPMSTVEEGTKKIKLLLVQLILLVFVAIVVTYFLLKFTLLRVIPLLLSFVVGILKLLLC